MGMTERLFTDLDKSASVAQETASPGTTSPLGFDRGRDFTAFFCFFFDVDFIVIPLVVIIFKEFVEAKGVISS
jgi:hypothetical protein